LDGSKVATSGSVFTFDGTNARIGGSGSGARLTVRGTGTTASTFSFEAATSGGSTRFLIADDGLTRFYGTSNAETMRLDNAGNLGIGTSSPATKLDVNGDVTQRNGSGTIIGNIQNSSGWYDFKASANVNGAQISTAAATPIRFLPNGVEAGRFDSSGNLGIGTSSPSYKLDVERSGDGITAGIAGGTYGIRFDNGGTFSSGASTIHGVDSTLTSSYQQLNLNGSVLTFQTGATERARITADGNIVAGASAALATTATNGFLYVPTCAGTPTGTPTAITGMAPIVVDTTNNKLYFYSTGVWRDAGP
jgi:hypothetical protein